MNMADLFPARVRGLQAIYPEAHDALLNWGIYSRTRYWPGPVDARPSIWDEFKPDENEPWGEVTKDTLKAEQEAPAKAERPDEEEYSERDGQILCERLHGPGGPGEEIMRTLHTAYVRRDIHESQYTNAAGCGQDAFCERLEAGLRFAARFA